MTHITMPAHSFQLVNIFEGLMPAIIKPLNVLFVTPGRWLRF